MLHFRGAVGAVVAVMEAAAAERWDAWSVLPVHRDKVGGVEDRF